MSGWLATLLLGGVLANSPMRPTTLRCEYLDNPIGIDSVQPRLSWILEGGERGARQTAYQIVVAGAEADARAHRGTLWDTGKVASNNTAQIAYRGRPLTSRQHAWWAVRVWDGANRECAWSRPAEFEMGLLHRQDWKAQWIGGPAGSQSPAERIDDLKWIWYPEGNPIESAPAGNRLFRFHFKLAAGAKVTSGTLGVVADNSFKAWVNGKRVGEGGGWQAMNTSSIADAVRPGENVVAIEVNNTDGPAGLGAIIRLATDNGGTLRYVTGGAWRTAQSAIGRWEAASFDDSAWKPAMVIASNGDAPWGKIGGPAAPQQPVPYLRKSFAAHNGISRARIYASALGLYQLHLNGKRIDNSYFAPGWTDYNKRIQYQTYDVTKQIAAGSNALGIILGDGWYTGYVGFGGRRGHYGPKPFAFAQLEIEYTDGTRETVVTDGSWRAGHGPIVTSDMLMGETYDARKAAPEWATAEFDDAAWSTVTLYEAPETRGKAAQTEPTDRLVAACSQPVRQIATLKPRTLTQKPGGAWIFDLGQNMVGWIRLKVRGKAGDSVKIRFAEILNPDGTVYTTNLRGARATDQYTLRGEGEETFEPTFTFHGFRYVELTGYPGKPPLDAVTGIVVHSDTPETATFACSNPMINRLQSNILWGMRGNYLEVPTDCPQRDERLGWMGDAQIFVRTGCYNMDISAFMTKWMRDVTDAQSPEGGFSDVSPRLVDPSDGAPAWGDAGVIVPWTIYQCYGDTRIISDHYEAMAKWIEYIHSVNPDLIWRKRSNNNFGDWLSIQADTPRDVLATAYFAYDSLLMSRMAKAIGREEDSRRYEALYQGIREAFNREFVKPDGRIKGDTQTCYVLALRFGLLPEALRPIAAGYLVDDIRKRDWHLSTGFVGVGYLTPTLTMNGHLDVAYRLLNQDTFPSWGYSIKQGATTIWERWDGYTAEKGFQDPGMNSFNHYSLGSVGEWMYTDVGGIDLDPAEPGYRHVILRPRPGGGFTHARTSYRSIRGLIESSWQLKNGTFEYSVTVPANVTATVYLPCKDPDRVTESGKPVDAAREVRYLRYEGGFAVFSIGSGQYRFTAAL